MANSQTKIEKWGLAPKVLELLSKGITSPSAIAEALNEFMLGSDEHRGRSVTRTAVTRFIDAKKPEIKKAATEIFTDHVKTVVPNDLSALEEFEALCLGWVRESVENRHARITQAVVKIDGEVDKWAKLLDEARDPEARENAVKGIVGRCLKYLSGDDDEQKRRLAAMRQATQIIDLKLTKAAMLEDTDKGRIIIIDRSGDYAGETPGAVREKFTMLTGGGHG